MTTSATFNEISRLLAQYGTPETDTPITPDVPVESFQLDSLELLEFMMALEEVFQIELDTDTLREDMTLAELQEQIEQRRETAGPSSKRHSAT